MAGKDIIEMSLREAARLKAVQEAMDGHITQRAVASMVGLSERQVLIRSVRKEGDRDTVHMGRGRLSNRRMPEKVRERAIALYKRMYHDFGPIRRYSRRWLVERFFAWLGWQRRLLARWEYHAENFIGFVRPASIKIPLNRF